MNKNIIFSIFIIFLCGCASKPAYNPNDIQTAPQMVNEFGTELAKLISPSHCRVLGCVNLISDENHFICTGEFSLIDASSANEKFQIAANKIINKKLRIDFTAEEGFGSQMLAAFFRGMGGGLAAGATGGGSGHYYAGGSTSSPVQFTLPDKKELK